MKLTRINTLLVIAILLINGITIVMPFLPAALFAIESRDGHKIHSLEQKAYASSARDTPNTLIMPVALFDQPVFEGPDVRTLRKGVWHRPGSSTPDKGGNTVFAAHRFTYSNPRGAFYNLDKLHIGDAIGVIWNNQTYRYRVTETKVVGPHEISIEAPTVESQLTLYTCTPLALPKNRLVVIAKPLEVQL